MEFLNDSDHFVEQTNRRARLIEIWADLFTSVQEYRSGRYLRAEFVLLRVLRSLEQPAPGADLDEPWTRCLSNLAAVLAALGSWDRAERSAFDGLAMCDDSFEPEVDGVRVCLLNILTDMYVSQGRLTEAERRFLRCRDWDGVAESRPRTAVSWSNADIRPMATYIASRPGSRRLTEDDWPGAS